MTSAILCQHVTQELLLARCMLQKFKLDELYKDCKEATGEDFVESLHGQPGAFCCFLDVGLASATTCTHSFGYLKGAVDGGMHIPHSRKRFPGYESEKEEFNAEVHRRHIYGQHFAEYMKVLLEVDEEPYQRQFSCNNKVGVTADEIEIYKKAHAAIRADPSHKPKVPSPEVVKKRWYRAKMTMSERRKRVAQKKASLAKNVEAGDAD